MAALKVGGKVWIRWGGTTVDSGYGWYEANVEELRGNEASLFSVPSFAVLLRGRDPYIGEYTADLTLLRCPGGKTGKDIIPFGRWAVRAGLEGHELDPFPAVKAPVAAPSLSNKCQGYSKTVRAPASKLHPPLKCLLGVPIDPERLMVVVKDLGGIKLVREKRWWQRVRKSLNLPSSSSSGSSLNRAWEAYFGKRN